MNRRNLAATGLLALTLTVLVSGCTSAQQKKAAAQTSKAGTTATHPAPSTHASTATSAAITSTAPEWASSTDFATLPHPELDCTHALRATGPPHGRGLHRPLTPRD